MCVCEIERERKREREREMSYYSRETERKKISKVGELTSLRTKNKLINLRRRVKVVFVLFEYTNCKEKERERES